MPPELHRPLRAKIAVVTGATSGVGRSIALALARAGAHVALVGRRSALLRTLTTQCSALNTRARGYRADLLKDRDIQLIAKQVLRDFGGVDILVHSAGVIRMSSVATAALSDFDLQYRCNVRAPFALTQVFLESLIRRKGQIVFINSTAGLQVAAGVSQYAATKHALKAIADSLREEVNSSGVRVLSIYLGRTATPMQAEVHAAEGRVYHPEQLIQPDQVAGVVVEAMALGPEAEIMDIRIRPARKPATSIQGHKAPKSPVRRPVP